MFSRYNSVWAQWIYSNSPEAREAYGTIPRKRRSLFRDVYAHDFKRGKRYLIWFQLDLVGSQPFSDFNGHCQSVFLQFESEAESLGRNMFFDEEDEDAL
jgi:hypothetical protein